jgi:PadR family transcriptional regulator, regulatory protein PadR
MLTKLEDQILLSVWHLKDKAYGVSVYQLIEQETGNKVKIGVIYFALDRLTKRGLLKTRMGEPTAVRGGMRKKFYEITPEGSKALNKSKETIDQIWKDFSNHLTEKTS